MSEGCLLEPPVLHADNGGPQKGFTMKAKLEALGVTPSYSRPRVSNDNPYSESLFRTVKYRPEYPVKGFESIEVARQWVGRFVAWYNDEHRHSAIRYVTPSQRHKGEDIEILANRNRVYQKAKQRRHERWSRSTRNWEPITEVWLNCPKDAETNVSALSKAA
jgi:putative transposase